MSLGPHVGSEASMPMRTVKLSELVNRGRVAQARTADALDAEMEELVLGHEAPTTNQTREEAIRQLAIDLLRHVRTHRNDAGLLTRAALRSIESCLRAMDRR